MNTWQTPSRCLITGTLRVARDALDQSLAAARHDDVDVLLVGDQAADRRAVGGRDHLHGVLGQARGAQALVDARRDRAVAAERLGAAAQDRRVAGLEAQSRGVGGHVRPRLVDDADDAQRHAHEADLDAGRTELEVGDLADGIGQRRDFGEAVRHRGDGLRRQRQPVDEGGVVPGRRRRGDVLARWRR